MKIIEWLDKNLVAGWRRPFKFHVIKGITAGMVFTSMSAAIALWYGSEDASQHALYPRWVTDLIFFTILVGCFVGRLWNQGDKNGDK